MECFLKSSARQGGRVRGVGVNKMVVTRAEETLRGLVVETFKGGRGSKVVFLHPGDGIESSLDFLQELSEHFEVVAPSHPGFGATALPEHFDSVDDLAMFYLDYLESLGSKVLLIGASFGAWIAAEIASRSTASIERMMLIGGLGIKVGGREDRPILDVFSVPQDSLPRFLARRSNAFGDGNYTEQSALRVARNRESLTLFGWSPTLHNPKLHHRLHRVRVPVRIFWGENDEIVSPAYGTQLANHISTSDFEVVPESGHYVHVDRPDFVIDRLLSFIAQGNQQ